MHNKCSFKAENIHIISHAYTLMHTHNLPLSTPKKKKKKKREGKKREQLSRILTQTWESAEQC